MWARNTDRPLSPTEVRGGLVPPAERPAGSFAQTNKFKQSSTNRFFLLLRKKIKPHHALGVGGVPCWQALQISGFLLFFFFPVEEFQTELGPQSRDLNSSFLAILIRQVLLKVRCCGGISPGHGIHAKWLRSIWSEKRFLLWVNFKTNKELWMRHKFPLVRDVPWPLSPQLGCSTIAGSCLCLGRSSAEAEPPETAASKAAAVQLTFMFAVALIFSLCAFYGSAEGKASSEVRGHSVNHRRVGFTGDAIVHANNNKIGGAGIPLGLWLQIFLWDVNLEWLGATWCLWIFDLIWNFRAEEY